MKPRFEHISEKLLVGIHLRMSLVNNRTQELWSSFMPMRNEISKRVGADFINLQVYDPGHYDSFNPTKEFEAWALVEVQEFVDLPDKMESFTLEAGEYAVFIHKGGPATAAETFQYIFTQWLPKSDYLLDNRPHFEVLGEKYSNTDPGSEEEVWIPIKPA